MIKIGSIHVDPQTIRSCDARDRQGMYGDSSYLLVTFVDDRSLYVEGAPVKELFAKREEIIKAIKGN